MSFLNLLVGASHLTAPISQWWICWVVTATLQCPNPLLNISRPWQRCSNAVLASSHLKPISSRRSFDLEWDFSLVSVLHVSCCRCTRITAPIPQRWIHRVLPGNMAVLKLIYEINELLESSFNAALPFFLLFKKESSAFLFLVTPLAVLLSISFDIIVALLSWLDIISAMSLFSYSELLDQWRDDHCCQLLPCQYCALHYPDQWSFLLKFLWCADFLEPSLIAVA